MIEIAIYQILNKILFFLLCFSILIVIRYYYMLFYHYRTQKKFEPNKNDTIAFGVALAYLFSSLFAGVYILS